MPLVSGATAAGFNIVRLLGDGQIGELYLAEHPRLPRQYALKILPDDVSADPEYRYRFNQESDLAAALWHPHIVGIHDRGEFEGRLWLAMDYVDGTDAAQVLTDTYPDGMPPEMVVEIVLAIADALDYAHEQGLVHRYVNPSNILLSNSESDRRRILLAGLGVARRPDEINNLSRRGLAIGTASYAAPEQLMDDSIDGRADQYALACTAFHLLTGSPPFAHMNPNVVISRHLNGPAPKPGDVKGVLTYFDVPFARALMKSPTERFRRCKDFAKALEAKERLGPYTPNAPLITVPENNKAAHAETAVAPTPVPVAASLVAAVGEAAAPSAEVRPNAEIDDAVGPTEVLREAEVDDVVVPPDTLSENKFYDAGSFTDAPVAAEADAADVSDVWSAATDDAPTAARRRRMLQTAGLGLTILVVAIGGILGVMALRSASQTDDTPTNVETPSPTTTVPPARPASLTAIPPPIVKAPAPKPSAPPTHSPSVVATTTAAPSTTSAPETTVPQTTKAHSPTTTPSGLDTRPAVGMPCGPPGSTATSNSGTPVACVDTPGGSAWEPPGGG